MVPKVGQIATDSLFSVYIMEITSYNLNFSLPRPVPYLALTKGGGLFNSHSNNQDLIPNSEFPNNPFQFSSLPHFAKIGAISISLSLILNLKGGVQCN